MRSVCLLLLLASTACLGQIGEPLDDVADPTQADDPADAPESLAPAFELPQHQVRLLPFSVRLAKLAATLAEPATSPLFDELRRRRLELGDFDYASGIVPDRAWSASRMSVWVEALEPVCTSPRMRERFPSLPGASLGALYVAAFGREPTPDDTAAFEDSLAPLMMSADDRYMAVCRAVFSSVEFVGS